MKLYTLTVLALLAIPAWGQYAPSASGSTTAAAEINSKPAFQTGTSDPANCTAGKDLFFNTSCLVWKFCTATNTWTSAAKIIASGSLALATSSISSAACQTVTAGSVNSATATGTATTDAINFTANGSIKAVTGYVPGTTGGLTITAYPTTNNVNFDVCNWTSSAVTPGAVTVNWQVIRQ